MQEKPDRFCVSVPNLSVLHRKTILSAAEEVQRGVTWPLPPDGRFSGHPAEIITIWSSSSEIENLLHVWVLFPYVRENEPNSLCGDKNLWSQLPQKARNGAQTLRSLKIHIRGSNMGLALNHHISTSSSHGLIAKPLSLLFPSSLLSFLHSVKSFTLLPHPHSVFQDFSLSYFPSLSSKSCKKLRREIMS